MKKVEKTKNKNIHRNERFEEDDEEDGEEKRLHKIKLNCINLLLIFHTSRAGCSLPHVFIHYCIVLRRLNESETECIFLLQSSSSSSSCSAPSTRQWSGCCMRWRTTEFYGGKMVSGGVACTTRRAHFRRHNKSTLHRNMDFMQNIKWCDGQMVTSRVGKNAGRIYEFVQKCHSNRNGTNMCSCTAKRDETFRMRMSPLDGFANSSRFSVRVRIRIFETISSPVDVDGVTIKLDKVNGEWGRLTQRQQQAAQTTARDSNMT